MFWIMFWLADIHGTTSMFSAAPPYARARPLRARSHHFRWWMVAIKASQLFRSKKYTYEPDDSLVANRCLLSHTISSETHRFSHPSRATSHRFGGGVTGKEIGAQDIFIKIAPAIIACYAYVEWENRTTRSHFDHFAVSDICALCI